MMDEPFSQRDHDEAVEDGTRLLLVAIGVVVAVIVVLLNS